MAVRRAGCSAAEVTALLLGGASADAPVPPAGHTALHIAAFRGNDAVAHALLSSEASVDARDGGGNTPLLHAAAKGLASMVALLLAAEADVDAVNATGKSAMHSAAAAGHTDIVEALLASGAAADGVTADGAAGAATPLMLAAEGQHVQVVELLLAAGADCSLRSTAAGFSVLHSAVGGGHPGIVAACLAASADPCAQATPSHSLIAPLHLLATPVSTAAAVAVTAGGPAFFNPWSAERLAGALDPVFVDKRIEAGDVGRVCELLVVAAGADVEAEIELREGRDAQLDVDGQRPLHIAASMGVLACPQRAVEAVEALLAAGAAADAEDARGCRPLDMTLAAYSVIMSNSVCEARLEACCAVMLRLLQAAAPGRPLLPLLRQLGRHNFDKYITTLQPVIEALEALESTECCSAGATVQAAAGSATAC